MRFKYGILGETGKQSLYDYYFKYLLEQLMEHFGEPFEDYLEDLMPWSDKLPEECKKKNF